MLPRGWLIVGLLLLPMAVRAQDGPPAPSATKPPAAHEEPAQPAPAKQVDVQPVASDEDIAKRLTAILNATEWFESAEVRVAEGVAFLTGRTTTQTRKEWAGQLAAQTQDVAAVVNRIEVAEGPLWDLSPAWGELRNLGRTFVQSLPLLAVSLLVIAGAIAAAVFTVRYGRHALERRVQNPLIREVMSKALAIPVVLVGVYVALRVSGLTQLAVTVLGGTGLAGLIIGIAFRDIAENYLASVLLSVQRPFAMGDRIEVEGWQGVVQGVTTRGTLLMTLDGNYVQVPNSRIYKATIRNFTANPRVRRDLPITLRSNASIALAQQTALATMRKETGILSDPEPLALVESWHPSFVTIRLYFWVNLREHSDGKVLSALIRHLKLEFDAAGVNEAESRPSGDGRSKPTARREEVVSRKAEGGLRSEDTELQRQADRATPPDQGSNLLDGNG